MIPVLCLGFSARGLLRRLAMPTVLLVLASGCITTGFGPKAVRSERPEWRHRQARIG